MASSYLGACTPRASQFSLHGHRHRCPILLEQARTAPFAGNRGVSLKVRAASSDGGGESYLGMWKKAMENEKKAVKFQKIVENSAPGDNDVGGAGESIAENLEHKSQEFEKILEVPKEERDRIQRMQVVDRAAAAIAAARALLKESGSKKESGSGEPGSGGVRTEPDLGGVRTEPDLSGAIEAPDEGMQDGSISVPQSEESSGTWTPGPDFWSWTPPSSDSSDDIIDLQAAKKPSANPNLSFPVKEKERSLDVLSIPLQSHLSEIPLPPLQSLKEVKKVDVAESTSTKEEHELGHEFSVHAAEAARALDKADQESLSGVYTDGARWWKESGVEQRPDGVTCRWTMIRGVSADQVTEWQDKYWEAADELGHKELGSEKSGRDAYGNVWREHWKEAMWQDCGLVHMEKSADKWGKNGRGDEWQEKWWEHYDASGQAEKWAHKWCTIDPNTPVDVGHAHIWHERWGETYDGHGGSNKYTDKWAERCEGDGWSKWGDKWDEHFDPNGHGVKQGETWWEGKYGERWNKTWGEGHNGSGWIHKYGKSSSGDHWDTHEQEDTWYERFPHFGFYHCFENSVQLREVRKPSEIASQMSSETSSEMPSETSSEMPSSEMLSETSSEMPPETSSEIPSETSSEIPSEIPSDMSSDGPLELPSELLLKRQSEVA
ncbi:protein LIKE EARLY STARVATION, chloroplastic [Rosa rugosa]|uniref:protein LIKE EARLY STARVATION, chloroplastic n=1 Tax=Rosa rugosa TaxID=74645 RepID=UPI002B405A14|nr:protein LIKE EARLY STARVATION, chloroplastic [Rosa rugosa]